jgi:hypothetical protein
MMRRLSYLVVVGLLFCTGSPSAQTAAKAKATAPEIPFDSVPNFLKLPAGLYMGEAVGVATNSKGNVFVFVRSGESRDLHQGVRRRQLCLRLRPRHSRRQG